LWPKTTPNNKLLIVISEHGELTNSVPKQYSLTVGLAHSEFMKNTS